MFRIITVLFTVTTLFAPTGIFAGESKPKTGSSTSEPPPIIEYLKSFGVKLTYLGANGGLAGYLGESRSGRFQTFYVTPDRNHVVAGVMNNINGINVTGVQIGEMRQRFEEAAAGIDTANLPLNTRIANRTEIRPDTASSKTGYPNEGILHLQAMKDGDDQLDSSTANPKMRSPLPLIDDSASSDMAAGAVGLVGSTGLSDGQPDGIDGSRFLAAANRTNFFEIGSLSAPTIVWKVADPNCRYCHQAWDRLQQYLDSGAIRVRIIPVAFLPGSMDAVRNILAAPDPNGVWVDSEGGRLGIPRPDVAAGRLSDADSGIGVNMAFATEMSIGGTPFLAYVDGQGILRTSRGVPANMRRFLHVSNDSDSEFLDVGDVNRK